MLVLVLVLVLLLLGVLLDELISILRRAREHVGSWAGLLGAPPPPFFPQLPKRQL